MGTTKWRMGGESFGSGARNEDDVEGHAWKSVEDDQVETGSEKPGDKARVKARVKNDDSDVEGHGLGARNADDDVEGHSSRLRNDDEDVEGHSVRAK